MTALAVVVVGTVAAATLWPTVNVNVTDPELAKIAREAAKEIVASEQHMAWHVDAMRMSPFELAASTGRIRFIQLNLSRQWIAQQLHPLAVARRPYTIAVREKTREWTWVARSQAAEDFGEFLAWSQVPLRNDGDAALIVQAAERFVHGGLCVVCAGQQMDETTWHLACCQGDCTDCGYVVRTDGSGQILAVDYQGYQPPARATDDRRGGPGSKSP